MSKSTQKETIEYNTEFLSEWNEFCDRRGYVKRQASHASRIAFMHLLTDEQREKVMVRAQQYLSQQEADNEATNKRVPNQSDEQQSTNAQKSENG